MVPVVVGPVIASEESLPLLEKELESLHDGKHEVPYPIFPYIPRGDVADVENPVTHLKSTTVSSHIPALVPALPGLIPFGPFEPAETVVVHHQDVPKKEEEKVTQKVRGCNAICKFFSTYFKKRRCKGKFICAEKQDEYNPHAELSVANMVL